jgi:hypothetical protein
MPVCSVTRVLQATISATLHEHLGEFLQASQALFAKYSSGIIFERYF